MHPNLVVAQQLKQQKLVLRLEIDKGKNSSLLHPDHNKLMKSTANISQHIMRHSNSFYHHSGEDTELYAN